MNKIWIAHRGNYKGVEEGNENKPEYILDAVEAGFDCEIDVWHFSDTSKDGRFWMQTEKEAIP